MFIDMHNHLIYGVDDGGKTFESTKKLALQAVENQVDTVITTPHITPGIEPFPYETYLAHLEEARQWMAREGIAITLYTGSEVLYTHNTPYQLSEGKVPTLAGTRYVLLEFSPDDTFKYLMDAGQSVAGLGFVPVFAHVERYECLKKADQIEKLRRECKALIQLNAHTVIRKHSFFKQRFLNRILADELVDFISTDCHDLPGRDSRMAEAFDVLTERFGIELATALTSGNAQRILDEAPVPRGS
ncbi:MAG: hypothetical protein IKQ41_06245 [Clostridia bacterium]|nr:hypothetical protein [Clostridia bacterium]